MLSTPVRQRLRAFNDAQTAHAGPWEVQAASLALFFAVAGWYLLREPSVWLAVLVVLGILWVRPVLRHARRQREQRPRQSPDLWQDRR